MRKNLLAIALSLLMVFSSLPISAVRADETEETTPNDETHERQEESQAKTNDTYEVDADEDTDNDPEGTPAEDGDPSIDYVKTEDDEIYAVIIQGDAARDLKAAKGILSDETDLDSKEIEDLVSELFELDDTRGAAKADPDYPWEADGTKIVGITTKWLTPDTVDNGDDSLLYVRPEDGSDQTVKLQINYSLAGEHDYGPEEVQIKIPAEIFWGREDEDGNRQSLGTMVLPFPEAPDTSSDFYWEYIEDPENGDYYLLTSTRTMEAATKGHIRIAFNHLNPYDLVDMKESEPFNALIQVKVHTGKIIWAQSDSITAQFDTEARVVANSAKKTVYDKILVVGPESIPVDQRIDDEEAYVYVRYYAWATIEANTYYTLSVRDYIPDEFGGFIINATSDDGREKDNGVVYEGTRNGKTIYYWFTVAYPVSKFTPDEEVVLHNNVEFVVTEVDPEATVSNPNVQDPDPQLVTTAVGVCNPHYTYREPQWIDPPGHYNIWKNGNDGKPKNLTRAVTAETTDKTRSDTHIGTSGYYGIYPNALNELQDGRPVEVSYTIDTLGYVFPWTYKEVTPGTGHQDTDGSWVWDIPAARIITNYLQRKVRMETVDMGTRLERYGDMLVVGTDYDYVSVEVLDPWIYAGEPHNINEDGSWTAIRYDDGTFLYTRDSDLTKVPDYHLEVMINGEWQPLAIASWAETGSRVITLADGTVLPSSQSVIPLPEGTQNIRNVIVTEKIAAIWYDLRVVIRLKPSATVMAAVNHQFEVTTSPTLDLWNDCDLIATREDTGELIVDIKDIPTQGGHPKDGFNELDGYTTDTEVYPYKEAEQNLDDIDFSTNTINIKYSARVEVNTVIKDKVSFNQAVADGRLHVADHGYWYDLLPEGVRYKEDTVVVRNNDHVLDVYTKMVEYNGVKRQLLIVEVDLTPTPVRYQDGDTFYYQDVPSIEFWAEYSLDNMSAYGEEIHNVIAFESDDDIFGTIEGYKGEKDDPTINEDLYNNVSTQYAFDTKNPEKGKIEKQMMKDLDPNRDTPSFVYAGVYTTIDEVDATRLYMRKDVDVNGENNYGSGIYYDNEAKNRKDVYEGGFYSYRLKFGNNDETIASNIRIFDALETFHAAQGNDDIDIDKPTWQGTFAGVNVQNLVDAGCDPVVYYATRVYELEVEDPDGHGIIWHPTNTDLTNSSIWTKSTDYTGDLADVKMVAIDASKQPLKEGQTEADDFELQPSEAFMVYIDMQAPSGDAARALIRQNAHAYNNSYMQASSRSAIAQNPEFTDMYVRQDYTKVGMIEHNITVKKEWDDQNNRDGLRPIKVVFHLYANGIDTGKTLELPLSDEDGNPILDKEGNLIWEGHFDNIPFADAHGEIHYTVTEEYIDAYTKQLIKEDDKTFKFVNKHEPEKIDIPGLKTWEDDDETTRPSTLTIILYADGVEVARQNISANKDTGEWDYVFKGVYKNREGEEGQPIKYTVKEVVTGLVSAYIPEYDGTHIINHYHPFGDLYVEKEIRNLKDIEDNKIALNKLFTFNFEFVRVVGEEEIPVNGNYAYDILEGDTVVSSGMIGVDYTWKISIKYYQTIHIKEIDKDVHYTITEENDQGFRLYTSEGATGIIKPNDSMYSKFINEYKAKGMASLKAFKMLECGVMQSNQFQFTVYDMSDNVIKSTTNRDAEIHYNEDGSIEYTVAPVIFSAINYTELDAGKTYRYRITESAKADGTDGVYYDRRSFYAEVTVEDNLGNGELDVNVKYFDEKGNELDPEDFVFDNRYSAEGHKSLVAWKELKGRELKDQEFTFQLYGQNPKSGEWELFDEKKNNGEGVITFEQLDFDQNDNGKTFYFLVREVKGSDDTVVYDEGYFGYKLTVTDTGKGILNIEEEMIDPEEVVWDDKAGLVSVTWKEGEGSMPVFENTLQPGILQIVKYIDKNSDEFDPDQTFTFHVELYGEDLPEGTLPILITDLESQFPPEEVPFGPIDWGEIDYGEAVAVDSGRSTGTLAGPSPLMGNTSDSEQLKSRAKAYRGVFHATDEELAGTAYAVLDADGNLTVFRSTYTYPNSNSSNPSQTVTDIMGNTYTGYIYADIENRSTTFNVYSMKTFKVAEGQAVRPNAITGWFNGATNLVSADVSRVDTSKITNMRNVFRNCKSLVELDLSTWDLTSVTSGLGSYEYSSIQTINSQSYVFSGCTSLKKLNCSNWTANTGEYHSLFAHLTALEELILENVHLNGGGWTPYMFADLKSLEVLDLSTFYIEHRGRWSNSTGIFNGSVFKELTLNSSFRFVFAPDDFYTHGPISLPTPTGEGYSGRWVKKYEDSGAYSPGGFPGSFNSNPNGMAGTWIWEGNIYYVSFTGDDVIGSMSTQMYSADKNNTLPANKLMKFGYTFDHWVDEANGYEYEDQGVIPKERYSLGDNIVLKAVFKKIETSVDIDDTGFDVTLTGGQMATIYGLPAGTSYTVTEIDIPEGWTLVNVVNDTGVINPLQTVTAYFTDKYSPDIATALLHGMKLLDGRTAEPRSFQFEVTEDGQTEFLGIEMNSEYTGFYPFRTNVGDGGNINFPIFLYKEEGVHTYRIREIDPNDDNVIIDSHEEVVTVTVTRNGEDGPLVADIDYDDDGIVFYNKKKPGELRIYKVGNVDEYNQDDVFTFKVTLKDSSGSLFEDGQVVNWFVEERTEPVPAANGEIVDYTGGDDVKPIDDPIVGPIIGPIKEVKQKLLGGGTRDVDENTAVLTYNANGGLFNNGEEIVSVSYTSIPNGFIALKNDVTREGYMFKEWNTEADGTGSRYGILVRASAILTMGEERVLYAQWAPAAKVTVNHYKQTEGDNYELADTDIEYVIVGNTYWAPTRIQEGSYEFYSIPEEKTIVVSEDETQNVVDYYYDRIDYTIKFDGNGADSGSMDDQTAGVGRKCRLSANQFVKDGYMFYGWNTKADGTGDPYADASVVADLTKEPLTTVTLYAQWKKVAPATVSEGVIYVTCRVGETIVIPELPDGTKYTVEEVDIPENWELVNIKGASGTIRSNSKVEVLADNLYTYKPAYLDLVAYKKLIGREIEMGEFTFELLDHNGKVIQTADNGMVDDEEYLLDDEGNTVTDASGNPVPNPHYGYSVARFDTITYTPDDVGYRFTYYVHEVEGRDTTVQYDMTRYKVTVEVLNGPNGRVITDVKYYLDDKETEPVFTNRLSPGNLDIYKFTKSDSKEEEFSFKLELKDEDGNPLGGMYKGTKYTHEFKEPVDVTNGMTFTLKNGERLYIRDLPAGTQYKVTEFELPAHWELVSAENAEGTIEPETNIKVIFTNDRGYYDVEAVLQVNKEVIGGTIVEDAEIPDHFIFELQDSEGELLQAKSTDEFGSPTSTVTFDPIGYTMNDAGKTFTYYIRERKGHDELVDYDGNTYVAEVTITDTGHGLTADIVYKLLSGNTQSEVDIVTFVNEKYGNLKILKINGDTEEPLAGAKFTIKKGDMYLQADGTLAEAEYIFTTDAEGYISVKRIPSGTYILHETEAPTEEFTLVDDIEFTMSDSDIKIGEKVVPYITVENYNRTDLKIEKVVDRWEDSSPVTFVFEITVTYKDKVFYHDVESMTYSNTGGQAIELKDLPVGAEVVVKEIYAGGSYEIKEGTEDELTITLVKDKTQNVVSFVNGYNDGRKRGYGAKNSFSKDDEGTWVWVTDLQEGGE